MTTTTHQTPVGGTPPTVPPPDATTRLDTPPPPPPGSMPVGPPPAGTLPTAARPPRRPWRDRLPELVAAIGTTLVAMAVVGFLSSTWEQLGQVEKAMVLGGAALGLTVAAGWAEVSSRRLLSNITSMLYLSATLCVAAAVTLVGREVLPDGGRLAVALGGVAAAVHAGVVLQRDRGSVLRQLGLLAGLLYAAGPFGTAVSDRWEPGDVELFFHPLRGLVDPVFTSDAFLLTGLLHAVIGGVWLLLSRELDGRAATAARVGGSAVLAYAALELNVLTAPVGALLALLIVLGYLVYGMVTDEGGLVVAGAVGALVAGVRVLAALFSGEVVVTIATFAAGITMLAWAVRAARARRDDDEVGEGQDG